MSRYNTERQIVCKIANNEIAYDATCNDKALQRQSMFIVGNRILCTKPMVTHVIAMTTWGHRDQHGLDNQWVLLTPNMRVMGAAAIRCFH